MFEDEISLEIWNKYRKTKKYARLENKLYCKLFCM